MAQAAPGRKTTFGGGNGSKDGTLLNTKATTIETTYYKGARFNNTYGRYKDEVLVAHTDGNGNVTFDYATWKHSPPSAKTNVTSAATTTIEHGAVNGKLIGVDLSAAKSVSGQTYSIKDMIKSDGFRWDGVNKRWVRK